MSFVLKAHRHSIEVNHAASFTIDHLFELCPALAGGVRQSCHAYGSTNGRADCRADFYAFARTDCHSDGDGHTAPYLYTQTNSDSYCDVNA